MENILEMRQITKLYPGVVALDHVDFSLAKGEVHAIVGENGAGKSTLIKILAGATDYNEGSIFYDGELRNKYNPHEALNMGISVIYQEFNLINNMTIEENIFFGREVRKNGGKSRFLDKKEMYRRTKEVFDKLGLEIDPKAEVSSLNIGHQQLAEIAKAVAYDAKIIVMDEPSATLTNNELELLFKLIDKLKKEGTSIIYISHRMEEIFSIADRVTVLRDGKYIKTMDVKDTSTEELIKLMVGRELGGQYPARTSTAGETVLEAKNLKNSKVDDVSFYLKKGEILGLSGLVGAGRTEVGRIIAGADPYTGEIILNGKTIKLKSPKDAIRLGIALLPEDRKTQGVILRMPVDLNTSMAALDKISDGPWMDFKKEKELVEDYVRLLKIKTPSIKRMTGNLSGGNQQKVILAKWLASQVDIFIFDEPTRGIDVGAKKEVYELMSELVAQGKSIIMISSELPELIGMSDRAYVMYSGRIVAELSKEELDQERIITLASGIMTKE